MNVPTWFWAALAGAVIVYVLARPKPAAALIAPVGASGPISGKDILDRLLGPDPCLTGGTGCIRTSAPHYGFW
jgi:hypothetical protein